MVLQPLRWLPHPPLWYQPDYSCLYLRVDNWAGDSGTGTSGRAGCVSATGAGWRAVQGPLSSPGATVPVTVDTCPCWRWALAPGPQPAPVELWRPLVVVVLAWQPLSWDKCWARAAAEAPWPDDGTQPRLLRNWAESHPAHTPSGTLYLEALPSPRVAGALEDPTPAVAPEPFCTQRPGLSRKLRKDEIRMIEFPVASVASSWLPAVAPASSRDAEGLSDTSPFAQATLPRHLVPGAVSRAAATGTQEPLLPETLTTLHAGGLWLRPAPTGTLAFQQMASPVAGSADGHRLAGEEELQAHATTGTATELVPQFNRWPVSSPRPASGPELGRVPGAPHSRPHNPSSLRGPPGSQVSAPKPANAGIAGPSSHQPLTAPHQPQAPVYGPSTS